MSRARPVLRIALTLAAFILPLSQGIAADRWQEAGSGAVAILPSPSQPSTITGGSLYCAEQKWGFLLRTEKDPRPTGMVRIGLEGQVYELPAIGGEGTLSVDIDREMLEPLKQGTRMRVEAGSGEDALDAVFNLRGSAKVIEAIAPHCSQIDMSGYESVSLSGIGAAVDLAKNLMSEEIELFREATKKEPVFSATFIDLPGAKRLLFGSLCGSTWYYGLSGCTLAGWVTIETGEWRQVYSTEGANLYLDRKDMRDGWPVLVTLPVVNGTEPDRWAWNGLAYDVLDTARAVDQASADGSDTVQ
jgi:hypothetical protein